MNEPKDTNQNKLWIILGIIIIVIVLVLLVGRFPAEQSATSEQQSSEQQSAEINPFAPPSKQNQLPPGFGGPSQAINPFTGKPGENQ